MRRLLAGLALLTPLSLGSCGSSESADKTAPFVGNWTVTTGTLSANCPAPLGPTTQKLDGGQQTITKAADGSLSMAILPGCNITLDVNGSAANLRVTMPPQSCMLTFMGVAVMGTFSAGNFTVTGGETASFSYTGTATLGPIACPVMGVGMAMKSAAPTDGGVTPDAGPSVQPDSATVQPDTGSSAEPDTGSAQPDTAVQTDTTVQTDTGSSTEAGIVDGP